VYVKDFYAKLKEVAKHTSPSNRTAWDADEVAELARLLDDEVRRVSTLLDWEKGSEQLQADDEDRAEEEEDDDDEDEPDGTVLSEVATINSHDCWPLHQLESLQVSGRWDPRTTRQGSAGLPKLAWIISDHELSARTKQINKTRQEERGRNKEERGGTARKEKE
ncbi:unnamed protein product, partial [Symbiodinium natans]